MGAERKTIVIGLDGASLRLINEWKEQLPTLNMLMSNGVYGELKSVTPFNSPPAWTSFLTGKKPHHHGISMWEDSGKLISAKSIRGNRIWDYLNAAGKRAGFVNIPMTYPAEEIDGFIVGSSLFAPKMSRTSVYPASLIGKLKDYMVDTKLVKSLGGKDEPTEPSDMDYKSLIESWIGMNRIEKKNVLAILGEQWDFLAVNFRITDVLAHFCWHFIEESDPDYRSDLIEKYGNPILKAYREADRNVKEILDAIGEDVNVIVVSDHGTGSKYKKYDGIIDTLRGEPGEWLSLFASYGLKMKMQIVKKFIGRIFSIIGGKSQGELSDLNTGTHKLYGIFIACGPDIRRGLIENASIVDIAPTVLHMLNVAVPKDMDGRVLSIFRESSAPAEREIAYQEPGTFERKFVEEDKEDQEEVKRRLRELGYIK